MQENMESGTNAIKEWWENNCNGIMNSIVVILILFVTVLLIQLLVIVGHHISSPSQIDERKLVIDSAQNAKRLEIESLRLQMKTDSIALRLIELRETVNQYQEYEY